MIKIDSSLVNQVSDKAKSADRKRTNHNFHQEAGDLLQRMLNALEPGTYIRPHKHIGPDKREAFVLIKGRILYIEYDDEGSITDHTVLDRNSGVFGLEITPGTYHSLISLEAGSVVYEIKDGPYDPDSDKNFAPWAPEEGSKESAGFNDRVLEELEITV